MHAVCMAQSSLTAMVTSVKQSSPEAAIKENHWLGTNGGWLVVAYASPARFNCNRNVIQVEKNEWIIGRLFCSEKPAFAAAAATS